MTRRNPPGYPQKNQPKNPPETDPVIGLHWAQGGPPPSLREAPLVSALESFLNHLGRAQARVSVMFGDDAALHELNRRFRGLNRPTDVLSWRYADDSGPVRLLGEIAISLERAESQAGENGWNMQTEVLRLLAHGCAHLAGHDHRDDAEEQGMKALEIEMLSGVGLRDIYPGDE